MQQLWFLHSACPLMLVDIFMKFHDASLYGLKVTERTRWRKDYVRDKLQREITQTRFDVYETLCPQKMLVHKGGQIKNWSGKYRDIIPTKLQCQAIQRALQSPNLQREIIRNKKSLFFLIFTI